MSRGLCVKDFFLVLSYFLVQVIWKPLTDLWCRPLTDYCQLLSNYLIARALSLVIVCLLVIASSLSWLLSLFTGDVSGTWSASYPCFFLRFPLSLSRQLFLASMFLYTTFWLTQNPSIIISHAYRALFLSEHAPNFILLPSIICYHQ